MRTVFTAYLVVILAGLAVYTVVGLTHHEMRLWLRNNSLSPSG
jgi:hypothetical protein